MEHDHAAPRENKVAPSTAHSSADAQPGLQQGAQRTRDRILQAVCELVLEEGASRLTLDAVVVRAGLSKGAFLYHFKTKRDLFVTLIDEMIRAFDAVQANHERRFAGDPDPWLSSQVEAMPDDEMQKMGAALLAAAAEDPTLLDPLREWYRVQYERVRRSRVAPRPRHSSCWHWMAPCSPIFWVCQYSHPQSGGISFGRSRISPRAISNLSRQRTHMSRVRSVS